MQRHEINIPTIYSHSIFVNETGKQKMLSQNQYNYFWSIIYLYRSKLLHVKPDGFIPADDKSKKRSILNPETKWDDTDVKINFSEIQKVMKGKNSGNQAELKKFIDLLENLQLKTNLFGKASDPVGKIVKPVKQIKKNFKNIELTLTKEFIIPLLITPKFYKKVALNFMFFLPTYKSKVLYLLFKDYDAFHKNFTKDDIEKMVGTVFSNTRIDGILEYINCITDIEVFKEESEFLEDTFKYTVKSQKNFVSDEEEIEHETKKLIWKDAEDKTEHAIETGTQMKSKDAYIKKLFGQIINDEEQYNTFETMAIIDIFIKEKKRELTLSVNNQTTGYWYVSIELETYDGVKSFIIDDNYLLRETIFPTYITKSAEETYSRIKSKVGCKVYYSEAEQNDCSKSLIKLT